MRRAERSVRDAQPGLGVRALGTIAGCVLLLTSCATSRPLVPLDQGEVALEASAPSVLAELDFPIQVPSPTIGARYGVGRGIEARVTLHPLHLFLEHRRILGVGAGGIWHVSGADGLVPALHFTTDLTLFAPLTGEGDPDDPPLILFGDTAVIAHWEPLDWLYPYVLFGAAARSTNDGPITSLYAGVQLWPRRTVEVSLEIGWFAFSVDRDEITAPLISPGRGVLYVGGAVAFRIGGKE